MGDFEKIVIEEMKETVKNIRDAHKNQDAYFSVDRIKSNMNNYFTGLQFALEKKFNKEYHWSNNGSEYYIVVISKGNKKDIL